MVNNNLDNRLSNLLNGLTFNEWSEQVIDAFTPDDFPISLDSYFKKRLIQKIVINPSLSFPAKIVKEKTSFLIELKESIDWQSSKHHRFILAHEIAHTFQYSNNNGFLKEQTFFLPGSYEEEFFSNRIARNILMPRKLFIPVWNDLQNNYANKLSLKPINDLAELFQVDYHKILQRLFHDLALFKNHVLFRFIRVKGKQEWKLYNSYKSNELYFEKKYFIPLVRKINKVKVYPSCKGKVEISLNRLANELNFKEEIETYISPNDFLDKPFKVFFANFVACKLKALISKVKSNEDVIINLLIDLEKGF
jgi:Zn-dependent peptidase ImmA (M78 family)